MPVLRVPLTKGQFALINDSDAPLIGSAAWQAMWSEGSRTFYAKQTYIDDTGRKRSRFMHRVIMGVSQRAIQVDHENKNGLDNQRHNLRTATPSQNNANTRSRNGSSRFKGVSWSKSRQCWVAQITVQYKVVFLGHFDAEEQAAEAYNVSANEHFGEFSTANNVLGVSATKRCKSSSRIKGVSLHKKSGRWRAYTKIDGRQRHIGMFATESEAIEGLSSFLQEESAHDDCDESSSANGVEQPSIANPQLAG